MKYFETQIINIKLFMSFNDFVVDSFFKNELFIVDFKDERLFEF
jgi:hypothetical protein